MTSPYQECRRSVTSGRASASARSVARWSAATAAGLASSTPDQGRVGDVLDAGGLRGRDRGPVLLDAARPGHHRADEQHPVAAAERLTQPCRIVEVPEPCLDPGREPVRRARHEHELVRGHACEQLRRDATAEVAGGARDDDRHETGSGQNPSFEVGDLLPAEVVDGEELEGGLHARRQRGEREVRAAVRRHEGDVDLREDAVVVLDHLDRPQRLVDAAGMGVLEEADPVLAAADDEARHLDDEVVGEPALDHRALVVAVEVLDVALVVHGQRMAW